MTPVNIAGLRIGRGDARQRDLTGVRLCGLAIAAFVGLAGGLAMATAARADPARGMAVSVVKAKRECFKDVVRVTGAITPKEQLQVRPAVQGARVADILIENGDSVSEGEVLARLARPERSNVPSSALTVQAPADGTVGRIMTQIGAIVSAAGPPMFLIIVDGEFELQVQVPSTRIGKLKVGQLAQVDVTGVGEIDGEVRTISPEINVKTQTGEARIAISPNPSTEKHLRMGTFGRATVEVGASCGTSVPLSAVLYGPLGPVVQVVRENRIETRPVPIGLLSGGSIEIKQGLKEGDLVVRRAGTFLREGDRVRPFLQEDGATASR